MKIVIESTDQLTTIDGVRVRVWRGTTAGGVGCTVLVHRIAVGKDADATQFEKELEEQLPPGRFVPLNTALP